MSRRPRTGVSTGVGLAVAALLLLAGPAAAANPVLDPEDDADLTASLSEAARVQDVCYGYVLQVSDGDTGEWGGVYASSSAGEGVAASSDPSCGSSLVELRARIEYTSEWSEAEDSAAWEVVSTVPGVDIGDVEDLGLSSGDLLDDGRSSRTLLDAVLALPRLAAEQGGLPPVVLEPDPSPLPEGARPTSSPGSDWLRENGVLLLVCVGAVAAGVLALVQGSRSRRPRSRPGPPRPPRVRSSVPPPQGPSDPWRR